MDGLDAHENSDLLDYFAKVNNIIIYLYLFLIESSIALFWSEE